LLPIAVLGFTPGFCWCRLGAI